MLRNSPSNEGSNQDISFAHVSREEEQWVKASEKCADPGRYHFYRPF